MIFTFKLFCSGGSIVLYFIIVFYLLFFLPYIFFQNIFSLFFLFSYFPFISVAVVFLLYLGKLFYQQHMQRKLQDEVRNILCEYLPLGNVLLPYLDVSSRSFLLPFILIFFVYTLMVWFFFYLIFISFIFLFF